MIEKRGRAALERTKSEYQSEVSSFCLSDMSDKDRLDASELVFFVRSQVARLRRLRVPQ